MLDNRGMVLLNFINASSSNAGYRIFSLKDIATGVKILSEQEVVLYIQEFTEKQLVNVRYQDENEVCLCVTPKGRTLFESEKQQKNEQLALNKRYFLYSFLGSFLGGIIFSAVALVLVFVSRLK